MKTVLLVGFGPFDAVIDNPAAALAEALDGCVFGGVQVIGREMPVSHRRSIQLCEMAIAEHSPEAIVGLGVAVQRTDVTVENWGARPEVGGREDLDGYTAPELPPNCPPRLEATIDSEALARKIAGTVGDDAGAYVCNSWLYQAILRFKLPVGFIHIPPHGMDAARLLRALDGLWGSDDGL